MDNRLSSNYTGGKKVQAVLSPNVPWLWASRLR